jgi:hypothetical protein
MQDTKNRRNITEFSRGLDAKRQAFFFLCPGAAATLSPCTGGALATGSRREAAEEVQHDVLELLVVPFSSGRATRPRIEGGRWRARRPVAARGWKARRRRLGFVRLGRPWVYRGEACTAQTPRERRRPAQAVAASTTGGRMGVAGPNGLEQVGPSVSAQ